MNKATIAQLKKYDFEPALPDALEREERKAKMDKVHKGFIPDPYLLGATLQTSQKLCQLSVISLPHPNDLDSRHGLRPGLSAKSQA